ncbi:MAG: hypothetical protein FD149_2628 [Rhodospirillaceae bacterium]|nr:MAG: hypothetical protein FD149_2628 [Rhodospirillaceae bacterium]
MLRRWVPWGGKLVLSGVLIGYLLHEIDGAMVWQRLLTIETGALAWALLLIIGQVVIGALRWREVLEALGTGLPAVQVVRIVYIAIFFNLVLPGTVGGDAVRMWKARQAGLGVAEAIDSVILERVATVLGLLLLAGVTAPLLSHRIDDTTVLYVFPALALAGVAGTGVMLGLDRLLPLGDGWGRRSLARLAHDARAVFLRGRPAVSVLLYSIIGHINLAGVVFMLAQGLVLEATFLDCVLLVPPVILLLTLPISIAGWGVREQAMITAFGFIGVSAENALALSILFGLVTMAGAVPGGVLWLAAGKEEKHPREEQVPPHAPHA